MLSSALDLDTARGQLTEWLKGKLPSTATDLHVSELDRPGASGMSNETLFFSADWNENGVHVGRKMVVRLPPSGPSLFPEYDLSIQYGLMDVLCSQSNVPVPRVFWNESDPSILGDAFFVMEHVDGHIPMDDPVFTQEGFVVESSNEQQAVLYDNALKAMCDIHLVDWKALGLEFVDGTRLAPTPLGHHIAKLQSYRTWLEDDRPNPVVDAGRQWVIDNLPTEQELVVLNWGDARIGNIIFDDDFSVEAVIDWESASLASPEMDLGYWLFSMRLFSEGYAQPLPAGFPSTDEVVDRYEQLTGYKVTNLDFYIRFAGYRVTVYMIRLAQLMVLAGVLPAENDMACYNSATRVLADLLDMELAVGSGTGIVTRG
jgi:aminoglycoside phosphotransferase (APT) family kinase protein